MWKNWNNTVKAKPLDIVTPTSTEEIVDIVKSSQKIRVAGAGYSQSALVPTKGTILDITKLTGLITNQEDEASFWAGTSLRDAGQQAVIRDLNLSIYGELCEQTLGGVIATASHRGPKTHPSIASHVLEMEIVDGRGDIRTVKRGTDEYYGAIINLGLFGAITKYKLKMQKAKSIVLHEYSMAADDLFDSFIDVYNKNECLELMLYPKAKYATCRTFNDWHGNDLEARRANEKAAIKYGKIAADYLNRAALITAVAPFLTDRITQKIQNLQSRVKIYGPTHSVQHNYHMIKYNEIEYAIPFEDGIKCLQEVMQMLEKSNLKTLFPIHAKMIPADDFWMSPFYKQPSMTIAIHQHVYSNHKKLFSACEAIFLKYNGRPHWSKHHSLSHHEIKSKYAKFADFVDLQKEFDPTGKFYNDHLSSIFKN